jgi:hypothetical protein
MNHRIFYLSICITAAVYSATKLIGSPSFLRDLWNIAGLLFFTYQAIITHRKL